MTKKANREATARHRQRLRRKGLVRVEVQVPREDARRLRQLSRVLRTEDGDAAARARAAISQAVSQSATVGRSAKEILADMPTAIPLDRTRDLPRDLDL